MLRTLTISAPLREMEKKGKICKKILFIPKVKKGYYFSTTISLAKI
jgi:hypothetical protein